MTWTSDKLLEQLALGEGSQVEFKEAHFKGRRVSAPKRDDVANELGALGNGTGGTLIFSVTDAGEVLALDRDQLDALESFVGEVCSDSIRPPLSFTTQRLALPERKPVLVVTVDASAVVHRSPGGYYRREGSSKRELSPEALRRLFQFRGRSGLLGADESIVSGTGRHTLDSALSDRFLSSRTSEAREAQLAKLGLLRDDFNRVMHATVAGVLLCTERPDEFIGGASIEAVLYRGTSLGTADQLDAATITGPLDVQILKAVNFVRRNTRVSAREVPGRVETPQFALRAVYEAIVNAVVHRDYSMENARIRIFIFDDRLEVYSPGALPNTLPLAAIRYRQATRNETLASLLRMLPVGEIHGAGDRQYFMEQRGQGVPIIYEDTHGLTGQDPIYKVIGGAELRVAMPSALPRTEGIHGVVHVTSEGRPLADAQVVTLYPNKTWMDAKTDTFGRSSFNFHSSLPITVFCAAPRHSAFVARAWRPPNPLTVDLARLSDGGSIVFTEGTGNLPGILGRLNPILDSLDRMYLYTTNVAINEGMTQPVYFRLGQSLRLTDVWGSELIVRFIEMLGNSSILES